MGNLSSDFLLLRLVFGFFEDFNRHIIDGGILEVNNSSVWTWFNVGACAISMVVIMGAKIIAHGLFGDIQCFGNSVDSAC